MKIIGSEYSPFVRMTRAVAISLGLDFDLMDTGSFVNMSPENKALIETHNPLMKVPVLLDGEKVVIDSRIIISYMIKRGQGQGKAIPFDVPLSDEVENLITIINGITDAGVIRFIMGSTTDISMDEGYMLRSLQRMKAGMDYLEHSDDLGSDFGLPEICLICMLDWFNKRDVFDWSGYKRLGEIYVKYADQPCIVQTRIPE